MIAANTQSPQGAIEVVRREALSSLHEKTGRNIILYYSGWQQKPPGPGQHSHFSIVDQDKLGFMSACNGLKDRSTGLDLILHTPGGDIAATESLVDYLHKMFEDIRVIVPQIAMSAGTMIACSAKSILMGKQSSLGPIDPQFNGIPAHGVIEEFEQAKKEVSKDPKLAHVWQPIINKYHPAMIGEAQKAIDWSEQIVKQWLMDGMLKGNPKAKSIANKIIKELGDHSVTKSHNRHLSAEKCAEIGLKIETLEDDPELQDGVLTIHHACIHTLAGSGTTKLIENQNGVAFVTSMETRPNPGASAQQPGL